jgi:hypothetical protein
VRFHGFAELRPIPGFLKARHGYQPAWKRMCDEAFSSFQGVGYLNATYMEAQPAAGGASV